MTTNVDRVEPPDQPMPAIVGDAWPRPVFTAVSTFTRIT
jgi:hypothetical protein